MNPETSPRVQWIEPHRYAQWTFDTDDRDEQQRQFNCWCGWFGFDETDEPERVDGSVWLVRSSLESPK